MFPARNAGVEAGVSTTIETHVTARERVTRRASAFRSFFEGLAVGAVQISPAGEFLEVNARYCALTGYSRDELLTMRVADLDHPADRPEDRGRWDAFLKDPSVGYDVEKRYVRRDGAVIWVHVTGAVIEQAGGDAIIAKTVEDITARVKATEVLRESEERLREALAIKEEFLGMVSHELRTPLTVIVGLAEILARSDIAVDLRDIAQEIHGSAEHLESLLESMLVLARADHPDEHDVEPIQLTHVLRRSIERHRSVHPGRRIHLHSLTAHALIEGHEPWIAQIVGNLLGNAEKYSPADASIDVVVQRVANEVIVKVRDEGVGVAEADLPLVFEPFYRAAHAREHSSGLGLGLAVCKRLVELQGGRIWARPRANGGTEFAFALPALDAED